MVVNGDVQMQFLHAPSTELRLISLWTDIVNRFFDNNFNSQNADALICAKGEILCI